MRAADWGWLAVAAGVIGYEIRASHLDWELLSEACDRYRRAHPIATDATICYLALHLLRAIPARFDPLHILATTLARR